MAYRFKLDEAFGVGVRRVALDQVDRAIAQLQSGRSAGGQPAMAVHEARKSLKRARAVLRLGRAVLGDELFKVLNTRLRDIGRRLAKQRDLDVLDDLVLSLKADKALKPATATQLRRAIKKARRAPSDDKQAVDKALSELSKLQQQIDSLGLDGLEIDTSGLGVGLDACRKAFERAFGEPTDEALHDLRKAVQLHWRHMQLLRNGWPDYFVARIEEARATSARIGADRDLGLLAELVAAEHTPPIPAAMRREIDRVVRARRTLLRQQARLRSERLLAEGTAGFCRRVETYWRSAGELQSR